MAPVGPVPFDRDVLDAFFAAVLVNDVVDPDLVPPDAVPLWQAADRLTNYYALCRQSWQDGLDRERLVRVAVAAMAGRCPGDGELVAFKHVRAKFKQLRYAHAACDRRRRAPRLVNAATVLMGQLQDACRNKERGRARWCGAQLRLMVAAPMLAVMAREAAGLRPVDPAGFAARMDRELDRLGLWLAEETTTGAGFHAARKVVSRHDSFWTAMAVLHPDPAHHRLFRWMSAANGLMGAFHDRLVAQRAADRASYRARFAMPATIAAPLALLVGLPRLSGPLTDPAPGPGGGSFPARAGA